MSDVEATAGGIVDEDDDDVVQLPDYADALEPKNSLKRVLVQASQTSALASQMPVPAHGWIGLMKRIRKNVVHLEKHLHDTSHIILALQAATLRLDQAKLMAALAKANNTVVAHVPTTEPSKSVVEEDAEQYSRAGVSFFRGGVVVPRDFAIGLDEETDQDAVIFSVSIVFPKFVDIIYDLDVFVYGLGDRDGNKSNPSATFRIGHNAFEKSDLVRDDKNKCWRATLLRGGVSFIHVPFQIVDLILPLGLQYDLNDWQSLQQNISVRYRYSATMLGAGERELLLSKPFLVPDKYRREWIFNNGAASLLFSNDKSHVIEDAETGTDGWPTLTAAEYAIIAGDPKQMQQSQKKDLQQKKELQQINRICALQVESGDEEEEQ